MKIAIRPSENAKSTTQQVVFFAEKETDYPILEKLKRHRDCTGFQVEGKPPEVELLLRRMPEERLIAEAERIAGCRVSKKEAPIDVHASTPPTV